LIGQAVRWIEKGAHRGGKVVAKVDNLYIIQDTFNQTQFVTLGRVKFRITLPRDLQGSIDSLVYGNRDVEVHFTDKRYRVIEYGTPLLEEIVLEFQLQCVLAGQNHKFAVTLELAEARRQHLEFEKAVKDALET
jgi:hypothetical protein